MCVSSHAASGGLRACMLVRSPPAPAPPSLRPPPSHHAPQDPIPRIPSGLGYKRCGERVKVNPMGDIIVRPSYFEMTLLQRCALPPRPTRRLRRLRAPSTASPSPPAHTPRRGATAADHKTGNYALSLAAVLKAQFVATKRLPGGAAGVERLCAAVDVGEALTLRRADLESLRDPSVVPEVMTPARIKVRAHVQQRSVPRAERPARPPAPPAWQLATRAAASPPPPPHPPGAPEPQQAAHSAVPALRRPRGGEQCGGERRGRRVRERWGERRSKQHAGGGTSSSRRRVIFVVQYASLRLGALCNVMGSATAAPGLQAARCGRGARRPRCATSRPTARAGRYAKANRLIGASTPLVLARWCCLHAPSAGGGTRGRGRGDGPHPRGSAMATKPAVAALDDQEEADAKGRVDAGGNGLHKASAAGAAGADADDADTSSFDGGDAYGDDCVVLRYEVASRREARALQYSMWGLTVLLMIGAIVFLAVSSSASPVTIHSLRKWYVFQLALGVVCLVTVMALGAAAVVGTRRAIKSGKRW